MVNSYQESAERQTGSLGQPESAQAIDDRLAPVRAIVQISGNVQGVGFRPFLYRLATEHALRGSVANSPAGVDLEIEGPRRTVATFLADIRRRCPPLATITDLRHHLADPIGHPAFVIAGSQSEGHRTALISPDVAVCDDCLDELFDPGDRRYRYPFVNCTNCGPRYTIINEIPYDRPATSMSCFAMCAACQAEYEDPTNRRFHAQPNACPECGPRVWLEAGQACNPPGRLNICPTLDDPIAEAVRLLHQGAIVAVKGLGGFHLACDATNAPAVEILRRRKNREEKPFALMVPDLEAARQVCHLDAGAESVITSRERPITLLPRLSNAPVADVVAPGNDFLGLMLPYTPLHYLLCFDGSRCPRFRALLMTSGNLADEPIAIGNREALRRLGGLADVFLLHDRDILVRADDSVVRYNPDSNPVRQPSRACDSSTTIIRRSRGYVPAPVFLNRDVGEVLAVGGHLKNTVAISRGKTVFLSQHIGDLESLEAADFLKQSLDHLQRIFGIRPKVVAHDLHPDYMTTRLAQQFEDVQLIPVQHHHAHVAACMAEHGLDGPVIGIALDGTGYGTDGNVWGGEILIADYDRFQRVAHFREVPLPGNEQAIKQPWRMALSYLDAEFGDSLWSLPIPFVQRLDRPAAELLLRVSRRGVNSPPTSSCGRLFDAVAALLGLRQSVSYEGQAAMELEMALDSDDVHHAPWTDAYQMLPVENDEAVLSEEFRPCSDEPTCRPFVLDAAPLMTSVVADIQAQVPLSIISRRFHQALVHSLAQAARRVADESGLRDVVLSGGCFQNRFLEDHLTAALDETGLSVFSHRLVPANDGGLALGQIMVAAANAATRNEKVI